MGIAGNLRTFLNSAYTLVCCVVCRGEKGGGGGLGVGGWSVMLMMTARDSGPLSFYTSLISIILLLSSNKEC